MIPYGWVRNYASIMHAKRYKFLSQLPHFSPLEIIYFLACSLHADVIKPIEVLTPPVLSHHGSLPNAIPVRQTRGLPSGFLQIPPHDGHPCLWPYLSRYWADSGLSPVRNVRRWAHYRTRIGAISAPIHFYFATERKYQLLKIKN